MRAVGSCGTHGQKERPLGTFPKTSGSESRHFGNYKLDWAGRACSSFNAQLISRHPVTVQLEKN